MENRGGVTSRWHGERGVLSDFVASAYLLFVAYGVGDKRDRAQWAAVPKEVCVFLSRSKICV